MYIQQFFSILWDHVHHPGFKFPAGDFIGLVNKIELDMIDAKRIDVELEILYKNDRYAFYDILFRKWLQKKIAF